MAVEFGTDEWVKCLMDEVNKSKAYHDAAKNWEGDFCFLIQGGDGNSGDARLYLDLWHGQCREAYRVAGPQSKPPEFTIEAPLATWRRVIERKLDPIQGIVMRQLKLKGNLLKIMTMPRAAVELVQCSTRIPTSWLER
jgi:putative sterol carrier protein